MVSSFDLLGDELIFGDGEEVWVLFWIGEHGCELEDGGMGCLIGFEGAGYG